MPPKNGNTYYSNLPLAQFSKSTNAAGNNTEFASYWLGPNSLYEVTRVEGDEGAVKTTEVGENPKTDVEVFIQHVDIPGYPTLSDTLFINQKTGKTAWAGEPGYKALKRKFEKFTQESSKAANTTPPSAWSYTDYIRKYANSVNNNQK